jgi:hypothetical protein
VTTERSESPNQEEEASPTTERQRQFVIIPEDQYVKPPTNLHPYTRPLTISDVDSCVALEDAAFANPEERATREKVILSAKSSISPIARDSLPILERRRFFNLLRIPLTGLIVQIPSLKVW